MRKRPAGHTQTFVEFDTDMENAAILSDGQGSSEEITDKELKNRKAKEQMEKDVILYRDQIPGTTETISERRLSQSETEKPEKHIQNAQRLMSEICKRYLMGMLTEDDRRRRMTDCFCTYYLDYLKELNLRIQIDPARWAEFRDDFLKYKSDSIPHVLPGQSWMICSRGSKDKQNRSSNEASDQEKKDIIKLMDVFHVPIDYYEPVPEGVKCPDESRSAYKPDHWYVGREIWKDDGGLLRDDFRMGSTIELVDHYGLKARIQVNDKIDDDEGNHNDRDHYAGVGTVEGYTSLRPRVIDIYTYDNKIEYLCFKKDSDDFGHPIWGPYNEHVSKKQKIHDKIIEDNIEVYSRNP